MATDPSDLTPRRLNSYSLTSATKIATDAEREIAEVMEVAAGLDIVAEVVIDGVAHFGVVDAEAVIAGVDALPPEEEE
jgi:hypothetical protein